MTQTKLINIHPFCQQFLCHFALADHLAEIKILQREVDEDVNLVPESSTIAEPLQMDDEYIWRTPKIKFLRRLLVLLASRAVPQIIFPKLFFPSELLQTIL